MKIRARHDCAAPGCRKRVPWNWLMCQKHWDAVPTFLRVRLYQTFNNGAPLVKRWPRVLVRQAQRHVLVQGDFFA